MTDSDVWAQLVSTTDIEMEHIELMKNKITIGRYRGIVDVFYVCICWQTWHLFHVSDSLIELLVVTLTQRKLTAILLLFL